MRRTLTTARLRLRPAVPADLATVLAFRDDARPGRPGRDERVRALLDDNARQFEAHGFGLWLVEGEPGVVGWVGLRPRESASEPELYYGLVPEARGHGYGTEAARAVLARLFARPATTGAWAVTDPGNVRSCRVLQRLGMRLEREGEFDGVPSRVYRMSRADWAAASR